MTSCVLGLTGRVSAIFQQGDLIIAANSISNNDGCEQEMKTNYKDYG